MERYEHRAFHSLILKPKWWKRYVDYTNVNWPHDLESLENFDIETVFVVAFSSLGS
jgi:hypothetical protein